MTLQQNHRYLNDTYHRLPMPYSILYNSPLTRRHTTRNATLPTPAAYTASMTLRYRAALFYDDTPNMSRATVALPRTTRNNMNRRLLRHLRRSRAEVCLILHTHTPARTSWRIHTACHA